jgi:hypothetical protein
MDDFLHRIYRLSKSTQQTPREDFLTVCAGRHLERDPAFAGALMERIAAVLPEGAQREAITTWLAAAPAQRSIEVRAQVTARHWQFVHDGRVDLLVQLGGPARVMLVIEAKVGGSVPATEQLQHYAESFPEAAVVGLVESRVLPHYPEGWPAIGWDGLIDALPSSGEDRLLAELRGELRTLLTSTGVTAERLALSPHAWQTVQDAVAIRDADTPAVLRACIGAMFPTEDLRRRVAALLASDRAWCEALTGWGEGYMQARALEGTSLKGLVLSVKDGSYDDEIVWVLEVEPSTRKLARWLSNEGGPQWWPLREEAGWFSAEICRSFGDRMLEQQDLDAVVRGGRGLLAVLHRAIGVPWHPKGDGVAPPPPAGVHLPTIREGVRLWQPVYQGLQSVATQIIATLAGPDVKGTPHTWGDHAYKSRRPIGPHQRHVQTGVRVDLLHFDAEILEGTATMHAAMADAMDARPDAPALDLRLDPDRCRVTWHIDAATWQHPAVAPTLAGILRAGLEA